MFLKGLYTIVALVLVVTLSGCGLCSSCSRSASSSPAGCTSCPAQAAVAAPALADTGSVRLTSGEVATNLSAASAGISVTGKTACAACEFGVRPIADASSLGMAVVVGNTVYIVEGAERGYPELFKARLDGLMVELKGTVKKTQGKFVWVEPSSLSRTR